MSIRNVAAATLALAALTGCAYLHGNFRPVGGGSVYRSGQLSPEGLDRRLEKHNIQTVVSLRSPSPDEAWYQDELAVCASHEVAHHDLGWSMKRLPPPDSLKRLLDIYNSGESPILVHCEGGTHRAAVASAVYQLARGESVDTAREELGTFFNDAPIGRLLDLYEGTEIPFGQWVEEVYPDLYETERAD